MIEIEDPACSSANLCAIELATCSGKRVVHDEGLVMIGMGMGMTVDFIMHLATEANKSNSKNVVMRLDCWLLAPFFLVMSQ